jgi:predicted kinase
MVGYPGSGKTTASRFICELTGAEHIWADQERKVMFGEIYDQSQSDELYEKLNERTFQLVKVSFLIRILTIKPIELICDILPPMPG